MQYEPTPYDLGLTDAPDFGAVDLTPEQAAVEAEAACDLAEILWGADGPEPEAELHM
jgi:hypothetical protein